MHRQDDPFHALATDVVAEDFASLVQRDLAASQQPVQPHASLSAAPVVGRLQGFDLLEQPLVAQVANCPGQVLVARTTVPLKRAMVGRDVVLLFADGDLLSPIIMGVIEPQALVEPDERPAPGVNVIADGERHLVEAEREIVLRCGDASITLTRAGKVIIQGNYILSRSTGYNKIKGAAIDIN